MVCPFCGHFLKCPGCDGFVCPACGTDLLDSQQLNPAPDARAAPKEMIAAGQPA